MNAGKELNPETRLSRCSLNAHTAIRAVTLTALLALGSVASADPPAAPAAETRVAKVSLADLDLSTPEGTRAALARVTKMAQRLCGQLGDSRSASYQRTRTACVRETVADAVRQINAPALVAREK
jgi:UrcA family protein